MSKKAADFFSLFESNALPATVLLRGEDTYLDREFKKKLEEKNFDWHEVDLKKKAPEDNLEDYGSGLSLFSNQNLLWVKNPLSPAQWRSDTRNLWQRMCGRCDGVANFIVVQVAADKRMKWDALGCVQEFTWEVDAAQKRFWLNRMNKSRGSPLGEDELNYLAHFDEEAIVIDNWVELWSLGGETWAKKALSWGQIGDAAKAKGLVPTQPAFAWVDAVLAGDKKNSQKLLKKLIQEDSAEPLQLMALLGKSVRILVALENGWRLDGQPSFLVDKLRSKRGRGSRLLKACTQIDRELKSSGADKFALMLSL